MPSDVLREPNELISVRKHKAPIGWSDVVPQTPLFKVKSCFSNSSSPASDPLSTRHTPPDLQLAKGANLSPDRSTLHPPSNSQNGNSQSPPQTSQSCFSSSFPSPLIFSRSHPLAFVPVPPSKFGAASFLQKQQHNTRFLFFLCAFPNSPPCAQHSPKVRQPLVQLWLQFC